jgi:hypothetical protein
MMIERLKNLWSGSAGSASGREGAAAASAMPEPAAASAALRGARTDQGMAPTAHDAEALRAWCAEQGWAWRPVKGDLGFIIEGTSGAQAWRLEWGPSQRSYVLGQELRLRAELGLPEELQGLLLSRSLRDTFEEQVFDELVETVQTRIDTRTPPEMRWLVMYPVLEASDLGALKPQFVAAGSSKPWMQQWLGAEVAENLAPLLLQQATPLVATVHRGRLSLRLGLSSPQPSALMHWLRCFELLLASAQRVSQNSDFLISGLSQPPSHWNSSTPPAAEVAPIATPPAAVGGAACAAQAPSKGA